MHYIAETIFYYILFCFLQTHQNCHTLRKKRMLVKPLPCITCESNGHPSPSYTIIHNNTKIVSNDRTYTIDVVQYSDAGLYKCIAENKLGNSSTIYYLSILGIRFNIFRYKTSRFTVYTSILVIIHCLMHAFASKFRL
jgi:hypothetical protein